MKIRTGFVSNSSSSSFIFWFNNIPESKEEVRILLYGENPPRFTTHWDDDAISTEQVASIVFDDIKRLDVLILEKLEEKRNQVNTDGAKNASNIIRKLMN